jgi:hypothetical protein
LLDGIRREPGFAGLFAFAMAYSAARHFRHAKDAVGMVVFSGNKKPAA